MSNTSNEKSLGEIADIRSGFTFRGKIEEVTEGNAYVLQIKDLRRTQDGSGNDLILVDELPKIVWEARAKAIVEPGTVLLPSRGGYYRAAYTNQQPAALPLVASSQFIVIKPNADDLIPEFLAWSLNQPRNQKYLEKIASQGTSMPMLSTVSAKAIKLVIPSLETQNKILRLNQLWVREQQLTQALLNNREAMLQGMFQQLLTEKK